MTIANTLKSLGARVTMSENDIRAHLKEDHKKFKEWTQKMAEGERTDERARAFAQLKPSLTAHARVEEAIAYDGLIQSAENKETDVFGREGYVEHHIADHLVERLSALDPATDEWVAHAKVLHEMLGHHIDEEESDIFAQLGEHFTREELEAMGARFLRDKANFRPSEAPPSRPPRQTKLPKRTTHAPGAVSKTAKRGAPMAGKKAVKNTAAKPGKGGQRRR